MNTVLVCGQVDDDRASGKFVVQIAVLGPCPLSPAEQRHDLSGGKLLMVLGNTSVSRADNNAQACPL